VQKDLLSSRAKNRIRISIEEASGNEVFFVGSFTEGTVIDEVRVVARGNNDSVPAVIDSAMPGEVVIHNHPSGNLTPSEQDIRIASVFGNEGIGFYIVDNDASRIYVVVEPFSEREIEPLDMDKIRGHLLPEGGIARLMGDKYELRDEQLAMLEAVAGKDPCDSTSVDVPVPAYASQLHGGVKGLRLGMPKEYFIPGIQAEVEKSVKDAIRLLEKNGVEVVEVSLPHSEYAVAVYYIIATAEASSNLARYDGMKYGYRAPAKDLTETYMRTRQEGFGPEVKRRIMLGTYALSAGYYDAYYLKAQKVRTLIKRDFEAAFRKCDVIITPTTPTTAFKIGEKTQDPLQMYLSDIFTISVNLAGLPGLSLPCGFDGNGLPIGMQIIGKHFDEATILRVAYAYEQATEWHKRKPKL